MLFRDHDTSQFNLVRCDRVSGKRTIVTKEGPIDGRWPAEAELKKLREQNRDPNIEFELQVVSTEPSFRASAFGDVTNKFAAWDDSKY